MHQAESGKCQDRQEESLLCDQIHDAIKYLAN